MRHGEYTADSSGFGEEVARPLGAADVFTCEIGGHAAHLATARGARSQPRGLCPRAGSLPLTEARQNGSHPEVYVMPSTALGTVRLTKKAFSMARQCDEVFAKLF